MIGLAKANIVWFDFYDHAQYDTVDVGTRVANIV